MRVEVADVVLAQMQVVDADIARHVDATGTRGDGRSRGPPRWR
jgi:hypothetical protein